jgi:hypothetical protein
MLLAFGPGVLLLFKKKLDLDTARKSALRPAKSHRVVL